MAPGDEILVALETEYGTIRAMAILENYKREILTHCDTRARNTPPASTHALSSSVSRSRIVLYVLCGLVATSLLIQAHLWYTRAEEAPPILAPRDRLYPEKQPIGPGVVP